MKNIFQKFHTSNPGANTRLDLTSMKKAFALPLLIAALTALFALAPHASANGSSLYWLGSNGTLWTAGDNWSSTSNGTSPVSFSAESSIVFSATTSTNSSTDLDGDQTISSLTINTTGSVPVGISGGNLTINGTSAQAITVEAGNLTISSPLILTGNATTITANQSTSIATITATNGLVFDGISSISIGAITANDSLQKLGSGTTTLTGNNTYTGNTTISEGTLALTQNGTLGNSTVSISGGILDMGGKSLTNTLGELTGGELTNGTLTNNGSSFNLQNGTISATLAGTNGVNKTTLDTVTLLGSNTYNGTTSVNAGILEIGNASGLGSGGNITFGGGTLQYGSGITADLSSRIQNSSSAIAIDTNENDVTFFSSLNSTNTGGLIKSGNGTLSLNGNSTYTGGTVVQSGTITGYSDGLKGNITNNATLKLLTAFYQINVTGTGGLLVDSYATARLLGNATMTGGTTILQDGNLLIGGVLNNAPPYFAGSIAGDITNEGTLIFDLSSGNRTFNGTISGNGSFQTTYNQIIGSSGKIFLTGNNTYTGGTLVSGGTVDISGGSLASTGNVTIIDGSFDIGASNQTIGRFQISGAQSTSAVGSGTLTATNGYDLRQGTVSLSLAGAADINKNSIGFANNSYDNGVAYLSANNTATGNITISGGILSFNTVQSLYSGNNSSWTPDRISVGANSTLALGTGNGSAAFGFNNAQIAEIFENLTQNGTGGLAANSKIGFNTTSIFTLTTNITDRPDGGAIGVDKIGASTLTLNSTNTFTGALSIFEGVVALGRDDALRTDSDLVVDSKSSASYGFNVGIYNQQFKDVTLKEGLIAGSSGSVIATGNYTMIKGNATANLSGNASLTKTNTSGSSYNVSEPEIVFLSGNNNYTGRTIVDGVAWSGTKTPSPSSNSGAPTKDNAKLQFQTVGSLYGGNETLWNPENISVDSYGIFSLRTGSAGFNGTQVSTIIQNLITANRSSISGGFLNQSVLGIDTNGEDLVINDDIGDTTDLAIGGGAVGLIKYGTGTLTLNGNSTRSFSTSVTGGNLVLGANANLSSASANLLVDTASLNIATTNQTVRKVTVTNGSIIGSGTLTSSDGGFVFGGANVTVNLAGAVGATIDSSSGTTTLSGNNTYNGTTTVGSGATLSLANVNALAGSTLNYVSHSNPAILGFSVGGTNTYNFGGLTGSGNITIGSNSLFIGANSQTTSYSGVLSGSGSVTKVGNGTLTLSGNSTYTGGTTINGGTLALGSGGASGSVTGNIMNNANLVFNRSGNFTFADIISGSGNVTKSGSGLLTLNGSNTYTGTTTISSGTLELNASLASTSITIAAGAALRNQNGGLSASTAVANAGTFTNNAAETLGSLSGNGSNILNAALVTGYLGTSDEISGTISGNGSLTKNGTGTLTLSGNNSYAGGTSIAGGTLQIGNGGASGSILGDILNNATLAFNRSGSTTYSGNITGTGALNQLGNGTLILTGSNTHSGVTTISAGTLQLGNGGNSGSISGNIVNNGTLAINHSEDLALGNTINGTGSILKLGNNTLTYSSTINPQGGTTISSGTLFVTGTTSSVTINNSGTLAGNGTIGDVVINTGGAIAPGNSPGTITTGNMTWNGGGIYNWELGNATGTAGADWDLISSTGNLTIGATSGANFTIAASTNSSASGFDPNARYYSWKIAEFSNIQGFSADKFTLVGTGFEGGLGVLSLSANTTTLSLNYSTMATWNAGTGNWTTTSNWEGDFAPIDGVAVEYAGPLGTNGISTNDDITLANISGLSFTSSANGSFTVAGGDLEIGSGGIVNNSTFTQTVALNITLGANQTFAANTANLNVSGNISGGYSLTKEGNQTLTLSGSNTYTGETAINAGTLAIASGGSLNGTSKILVGNSTSGNALSILGSASTGNVTLSQQVGSDNNTATVGGGSIPASLTVANLLNIGFGGTGNTLDILGNGTVTAAFTEIGGYGANNTLNLTGGVLNSTGYLVVGYFAGENALNITSGGNATVGSVTVGLDTASSNNTILVSGTGSALNTADLIYLGENGASNSILVENGGKVVSQIQDAVIGLNSGSNNNALTVNATGSQFTNNGTLHIGKGGSENSLSIQNGALIVTKNSRIGRESSSSNNTAAISGAGSLWNNTGTLRVGDLGANNTLAISSGANVTISGNTFIGHGVGSDNNLISVEGSGSVLNLANATVGLSGSNNTLLVADFGTINAIGIQLSGMNSTLQIGNGAAGGTITTSLGIGTGSGTGHQVIFDHTDSNLTFSPILTGNLSLSQIGNGTTTLTSSNTYTGGTTINSGTLLLESTAQISHSGAGFYVGGEGENAVVILNGGSISNFDSYIGFGNGSTGMVNMNSGNWTNGENFRVGYYGNGTLNLIGGSISNVNGVIGRYGASNGVANVSGGTWSSSGTLRIGYEASGTLNLTGGNVIVSSGTGNVTIGVDTGSSGILNIGNGSTVGTLQAARVIGGAGTAIVNFNHTVASHTFSPILSGNLLVNKLGSGTTALTGNNSYSQGTVITAGTLAAQSTTALGTGHVDLNNNGVLAIGSFANGLANMTLSLGGNLSWSSNSSTIALLNGASANITGSLSSNGVVGNRTFDVSQYGVVSNNTITLARFADTDIPVSGSNTANATFDISFTSLSQSSTVLTTGNFLISGNLLKYVIASATANGSSLDIRNSDADFIVNTPTTAGTTVVTGQNPLVKDVIFQGSNNLLVPNGVALMVFGQAGKAAGQLDVQNGTSSTISGSGTIEAPNGLDKIGGGELDLQSNTNVTGIATVVEGLLSVNGQLTATSGVVVDPGASLGGAGFIVGNVVVNGNLSPGNSPGTLTVAGNMVLTGANSTIIEIASPTNFDRIVVSGQATLGGTLQAVAYDGGTITPGMRYDFLQAGSIVGEFDSIVAPEGLRARFLNSGTIGTLLFGPGSYVPMAINQNQRNVAKALDTFILAASGDRETVSIALDALTTEQFPAAFDQIMPGFYESLADIAIEQTYNQSQLLTQRMGSLRLGAQGFQAMGISQPIKYDKDGKSAADAKTGSPIVASAIDTNWNSWVMANGEFSQSRGLAGVPNYNNNAGGFLVGADYRLSENFAAGLFAGYEYNYAKYDGGSSTRGNSALFGLYGSYTNENGYYADAIVSGGYTGFQTRRSIEFSTIDRTASADPNSGQFSAALNLGKDFEIGKFTLGPIVGAQYTYAGIGGFTETGADSLDLALGQQNANSLRTNLGARLAYNWEVGSNITLIPEVRGFWMHEFLNNSRNISSALDGGNGASFDYETESPYRNSVFAGAGVSARFGDRWSASVFYNVNFGSENYTNNIISTSLGFSF
jgi:fibronectin-binding autotransporter adhesin